MWVYIFDQKYPKFNYTHDNFDIIEEANGKVVLKQSKSHQKNIELGYTTRDFSIEMAALHYENPEGNKYR